jgi:hypothetical protein
MELKSEEQWRDSLGRSSERSLQATPTRAIRLVSVEEYAQALCSLESVITEKQRNMLVAHAMAPGRSLTMTELAALVGFPNYSAANLQYGLLAGKLADALGIQRPVFLVYVIASFDDDPDTLHSRAHMYPELFAALQQLGWVAAQNATQALIASGSVLTDVARPATPTTADGMLCLHQVITTLESHGFIGCAPTSAELASNHAGCVVPDPFDLQGLTLTDTERDALIKVRIGQSGYRDALLEYWGGCAITDCTVPALLRASHIKPWRDASARERLDPYNGLLLTPNLDLAFDQGLISFNDHGHILISEDLDPESAQALNITPELRLRQIEPPHRAYLAWHREHLFRK